MHACAGVWPGISGFPDSWYRLSRLSPVGGAYSVRVWNLFLRAGWKWAFVQVCVWLFCDHCSSPCHSWQKVTFSRLSATNSFIFGRLRFAKHCAGMRMNQFVSKDFPAAFTRQDKPMSVYRTKAGKSRLIKDSTRFFFLSVSACPTSSSPHSYLKHLFWIHLCKECPDSNSQTEPYTGRGGRVLF